MSIFKKNKSSNGDDTNNNNTNTNHNINQDSTKNTKPVNRVSIFDTEYPIDKSDWFQVFSACLGKVVTIQNACAGQVVKGQNWNVDFSTGMIQFGNDSYPVQFIGSESTISDTWLWGWENVNGFDESLLKFANELKEVGEKWNLEPFMVSQFSLGETLNGHYLSIAACGILKENYCYYRGPHENGAVFMAFSGVPDSVFAPVGIQEFAHTVLDCIQQMPVEHKIFVESYLIWNGNSYEWDGNTLTAHFEETDLVIGFENVDGLWRIKKLNTKIGSGVK